MDTNHEQPPSRFFWRDMGPTSHACHFYADRAELLESLTAYVGGGLWKGEAAVVIASNANLDRLDQRLRESGLDLAHFRNDDRYIALSAEGTLPRFMVDGWPDDGRFTQVIGGVVARARRGRRPVRAFGEMVAILWAQGQREAAVRLEHLWNRLIERERFPLLCAYRRRDFRSGDAASMQQVRAAHSLVGEA